MAKKVLLPFGRALVASGALILAPDDAALDADLVPAAVAEDTRSHERHEPGLPAVEAITQPRAAWLQRERILSLNEHAGRARDFLILAREHDHEAYQVEEAAEVLGLTRRHLHRQSVEWFGLGPGVVIDLHRMCSIYTTIVGSCHSLSRVAAEHSFLDLSKMGLFTLRFTRLRPRAIRQIGCHDRTDGPGR